MSFWKKSKGERKGTTGDLDHIPYFMQQEQTKKSRSSREVRVRYQLSSVVYCSRGKGKRTLLGDLVGVLLETFMGVPKWQICSVNRCAQKMQKLLLENPAQSTQPISKAVRLPCTQHRFKV